MPWAGEPLHTTLHSSPGSVVYEARLPYGRATALHAHTGVTAYVVVTAPVTPAGAPAPVTTETVEWEVDEASGGVYAASLVRGEMVLTPGAAFAFVVDDPTRPLVHRLITPPEGAGPLAVRVVGVEVRRRRGGGLPGEGDPGPPPPFALAAAGPGFRILRLILDVGARATPPPLAPGSVLVTVRGGEGLVDDGDKGGGKGCGGAPPSPFVAAATAPSDGVLVVGNEQLAGSSLMNAGRGVYEVAVVELT